MIILLAYRKTRTAPQHFRVFERQSFCSALSRLRPTCSFCSGGLFALFAEDVFGEGVGEGFHVAAIAFVEGGIDGDTVTHDVHGLALRVEQFFHEVAGFGSPGAVFNQGKGAVLHVEGGQIHEVVVHDGVDAEVVGH